MRVSRRALHEAMALLCRCVDTKSSMNLLRYVVLHATDRMMFVTATDLTRWLTLELPCEGELAPCCVVAELLKRSIAKDFSNGDPVDLRLDDDGRKLTIEYDGGSVRLTVGDTQDFPKAEPMELGAQVLAGKDELVESLKYVIQTACTDPTRPAINVVRMGRKMMAATDGHRLHAWEIDTGLEDVSVPRVSADLFLNILEAAEDGQVRMETGKSGPEGEDSVKWLYVNVCGKKGISRIGFRTKTVDLEFPDVNQVIPGKENRRKIVMDSRVLQKSLDRLRAIQKSGMLQMVIGGDMKFAMEVEGDEVSSEVKAVLSDFDNEALVTAMKIEYLSDAIKSANGQIEMWFEKSLDPITILSFGKKATAIVMPMRI